MKDKSRFSSELLGEFGREAKQRIAENIRQHNKERGEQPPIEFDAVFDPCRWLEHAIVGFAEPAPSQWGTILGCARLESERLYIHCYRIIPNEDDGWSTLYIGTLKDPSITPRVIGSMIATQDRGSVHWLETSAEWRRQGYAMEFLRAIEKYRGEFTVDSATEAGEGFLRAYDRNLKSEAGDDNNTSVDRR